MVSLRVVSSKVLRMAIQIQYFFIIKRQYGDCKVRNFRLFLFGINPDVPAFKVLDFTGDFKILNWSK